MKDEIKALYAARGIEPPKKIRKTDDPDYRKKWRAAHPTYHRDWYLANRDRVRGYYEKNIREYMWRAAKQRADQKGLAFTIVPEDVVIPEVCPVFGTSFRAAKGRGPKEQSPSLDRIDNSMGYVPGNIAVISWRANQLKNNGTIEELRAVLAYMEANQF